MTLPDEINRGYIPATGTRTAPGRRRLVFARRPEPFGGARQGRAADAVRILLLPSLLLLAVGTALVLRAYLAVRRPRPRGVHADALALVGQFVRQYPLQPYAIVCKAFELAYLLDELPAHTPAGARVLEVAIGEGTLSERVFPADARVVGTDISPYSLRRATEKAHVRQAVVCDCLAPPFRPGSFDLLVANNFLHHVTGKRETLLRWTESAEVVMFNENATTWASGWPRPFALRVLGARARAQRVAEAISRAHLQHLETLNTLDKLLPETCEVTSRSSYFSERTFAIAGLFSSVMRCTGPPTPAVVKRVLTGRLRFVALPLSREVARLLIRYDVLQDRGRDAYVSYTLRRRSWAPAAAPGLVCPDCGAALEPPAPCSGCGRVFPEIDGMLFVLPEPFRHIEANYSSEVARLVPAEHL